MTIGPAPRSAWPTALAPMAWGTTYAVTSELLPPGRPLLAAALRSLPAGLLILAATRELPSGRWWWRSVVLGVLNFALFFSMLFTAAYRLPGGVAATVGSVQPLIVVGLAAMALRERVASRKLVAGGLGIVGVALLVLRGNVSLDGVGVLAAAVGATSMAAGTTLVQRWGRPSSALSFAGWQLVAGGVLLTPIALVGEGLPSQLTASNALGYAYLATIGGALAYTLWFRGIALLGASRATFLSLLSSVVATVVGFTLGDRLSAPQLAGALLVLSSVALAQVAPRRAVASAPPPGRVSSAPLPPAAAEAA